VVSTGFPKRWSLADSPTFKRRDSLRHERSPREEYVLTPAGEHIGAFLTEMDSTLSVGGDGEETYLISSL
jgi:hypothetical protein